MIYTRQELRNYLQIYNKKFMETKRCSVFIFIFIRKRSGSETDRTNSDQINGSQINQTLRFYFQRLEFQFNNKTKSIFCLKKLFCCL